MTYDYDPLKTTAGRLIDRFGKDAVLRKAGEATGDPWNPTPGADTDYAVRVVETNERVRDRSGTLTGQTLTTIYLGGDVEPAKADRLQLDGAWFEIDAVRPTQPGPVAVLWECDVIHG